MDYFLCHLHSSIKPLQWFFKLHVLHFSVLEFILGSFLKFLFLCLCSYLFSLIWACFSLHLCAKILGYWIQHLCHLGEWALLSFLLSMVCVFPFFYIQSNFGLYTGCDDWYIIKTMDSVMFLQRVLPVFFSSRQLIWLTSNCKLSWNEQELKFSLASFSLSSAAWSLPHALIAQGNKGRNTWNTQWLIT